MKRVTCATKSVRWKAKPKLLSTLVLVEWKALKSKTGSGWQTTKISNNCVGDQCAGVCCSTGVEIGTEPAKSTQILGPASKRQANEPKCGSRARKTVQIVNTPKRQCLSRRNERYRAHPLSFSLSLLYRIFEWNKFIFTGNRKMSGDTIIEVCKKKKELGKD